MCKHEPGTVGSLTDPKVIINELDLEDCLTALVTLVRVYKRKKKSRSDPFKRKHRSAEPQILRWNRTAICLYHSTSLPSLP